MIVGDMDSAGEAALRCGAELVLHSYPDGRAPGRQRLEELGLAFKLVPAPGTSQDVAMLIAAEKGARLIVSVGSQFNLVEFLDRNRKGMSSTFLTRLRIGEILVDAKGVSRLYQPRPGLTPLLVVIAAGLMRDDGRGVAHPRVARRGGTAVAEAPDARRAPASAPAADPRPAPGPMFDYRYHALSLAAVLFALALGVLLGVAIGDSNLVSSAKNGIVHDLNSEANQAAGRGTAAEPPQRRGSVRQRPVSARRPRTAHGAQIGLATGWYCPCTWFSYV